MAIGIFLLQHLPFQEFPEQKAIWMWRQQTPRKAFCAFQRCVAADVPQEK
jgi:hypothetical protein